MGFSSNLYTQKIQKFFDNNWSECNADTARFYAEIQNTDSGWIRRDYYIIERKIHMKGLFTDSSCKIKNGYFYTFHPTGILDEAGKYKTNRKEGLWLGYHPNGYMKDSIFYDNGEPKGISLHWYNNGYLSDSTNYKPDGTAVQVSWFDDGSLSSAGRLSADNLFHGKWQFFHRNGKLSATEVYNNGKLVDRKYFAEDGTPISDTADKTQGAVFPGGIPAWQQYLSKKLYWPANYKIVNNDKGAVGVDFMVDENGLVKDVNINTPFHPAFNDIVLQIIKGSPKWVPAISHNRRVPYHHKQMVTFKQVPY